MWTTKTITLTGTFARPDIELNGLTSVQVIPTWTVEMRWDSTQDTITLSTTLTFDFKTKVRSFPFEFKTSTTGSITIIWINK